MDRKFITEKGHYGINSRLTSKGRYRVNGLLDDATYILLDLIEMSDSINLSDSSQTYPSIFREENINLTDEKEISVSIFRTDNIDLTESITSIPAVIFQDNISVSDEVQPKDIQKFFEEVFRCTDTSDTGIRGWLNDILLNQQPRPSFDWTISRDVNEFDVPKSIKNKIQTTNTTGRELDISGVILIKENKDKLLQEVDKPQIHYIDVPELDETFKGIPISCSITQTGGDQDEFYEVSLSIRETGG